MSCDTFVALSPATNGCIIFGKNSDRPPSEVQEIVYRPAEDYGNDAKVQVTYLEIPQVPHTHSVLLSKPAWMWGAEMGANEHGVVIGNEAVWTKLASDNDKEERLLGMDLVRLGLERSASAGQAVTVITALLEEYGQGGPCYEDPERTNITYHNSFIIADGNEAWILETAGKQWAAEKVTGGVRNLSNLLTIGTKMDQTSSGLKVEVQSTGLWSEGDGDLDFAKVLAADPPTGLNCPGNESPENRYKAGKALMEQYNNGSFDTAAMISILRDQDSGICRIGRSSTSVTMSSQVSVLYPGSPKRNVHWVTGTPNPARSLFKPFIFCPAVVPTTLTVSPDYGDQDPARIKPRFSSKVDRQHALYEAHQKLRPLDDDGENEGTQPLMAPRRLLQDLEESCIRELDQYSKQDESAERNEAELAELFKDAVESEIKFYPKVIRLN